MVNKIIKFVNEYGMLDKCGQVIVGLSGGADSVCLFRVLLELREKYNFSIKAIHVHHGIRKEEADRDMEFCKSLCAQNQVDFICKKYDVPTLSKELSMTEEEAGRYLRYKAFDEEAANYENVKIAVAHHSNDRAETVIFNMIRGTGIKGMVGIRPVRDNIIRPLLCCTKEEILKYLEDINQPFCEDSTNKEDEYTRNNIRHNILPLLSEINEGAVKNICAMASKNMEAWDYLEDVFDRKYHEYATMEVNGILLSGIEKEPPFVRKNLIIKAILDITKKLKDITTIHIEDIEALLWKNPGSRSNIKYGISAIRESDGIFFTREMEKTDFDFDVSIPSEIQLENEGIKVSFRKILAFDKENFTKEVYTKSFDYDKIQFGLQLRNRRDGDYFVADKEGHKKKLNQYFIDEKFPGRRRDCVPLLADGSHIMWVIGGRISEAYKVDAGTKNILIVEVSGYGEG